MIVLLYFPLLTSALALLLPLYQSYIFNLIMAALSSCSGKRLNPWHTPHLGNQNTYHNLCLL